MFVRHISIHLKPTNTLFEYTRAFESKILPLLRKQKGFKDAITLSNPGSPHVVAISLWDSKAHADAYDMSARPEVSSASARLIDGTPKIRTFRSVSSTFHKLGAGA
jgi:heme-degrading monooxygenase HmoA